MTYRLEAYGTFCGTPCWGETQKLIRVQGVLGRSSPFTNPPQFGVSIVLARFSSATALQKDGREGES